mmetsp:Transcript_34982/g.48877  ORF Transcript_34982/g.48877 Transcript_34982/m.48877 type:complete len:137 (-) Transcript_34982:169-579(-)
MRRRVVVEMDDQSSFKHKNEVEVGLLDTVADVGERFEEEEEEGTEMHQPVGATRSAKDLFPIKEFLLALSLTLGGIIFLPIGLYELFGRQDIKRALPFLCITPLVLLPGSYHLHIIVRAYLGHRGFRYSQVVRRLH